MIPEIGHFCLIIALMASGLQSLRLVHQPLVPTESLHRSVWLQTLMITLAFACLIIAYMESDFSVLNVAKHSHTAKPMIFKIAASWGNHEGSMLLWVTVLAGYGLWLSLTRPQESLVRLRDRALEIQGLLQTGFLTFILFTSNPFTRQLPIPIDGQGLNPLLQDIGLSFHPPLLYAGYVGFGIVFALGMAALIEVKSGKDYAKFMKPFIMVPWVCLSLGIAAGSWWAYRELGWGGWWFWDPVENASLLPWLAGTALFHSNIVLAKRGQLGGWVVLLSVITFSLSMIGTFLVRSGIITSVHSFVSDPERGLFILMFLVAISGAALFLFGLRAHKLSSNEKIVPLSREGSIVINNLFLLTATMSVLLATTYPMIQELMGARTVTIGAPYFNKTFFPLMAPLVFLGGFALAMPWGGMSWRQLKRQLATPLMLTITISIIGVALVAPRTLWLVVGIVLGLWLMLTSKAIVWKAVGFPKDRNLGTLFARIKAAPPSVLAAAISHGGVGLLVVSIAMSSQLKEIHTLTLSPGESKTLHNGGSVTYRSYDELPVENFIAKRMTIDIADEDGTVIDSLFPEKRFYPAHDRDTTEAAIHSNLWRDNYAAIRSIHEEKTAGGTDATPAKPTISIEIFFTPFMLWLWIAMLTISFGGIMALRSGRKSA